MSPAPAPLVRLIVCGNPDRGDEGAAVAAVARVLPALPAPVLSRLEVRRCTHLAAADLADVPPTMRAVVVDAAAGVPPGEIVVVPLAMLEAGRIASRSRAPATAAELAPPGGCAAAGPFPRSGFAQDGRRVPGSFIGIGGRSFGFGAMMSRPVRDALDDLGDAIERELTRLTAVPV